ncbi:MAG TPA: sugar nucleotide-binding protein [Baekduia sp.]
MRKLLVTGASGYLGRVVAQRAATAGWDVVGTHGRHVPEGVRSVALDVRDAAAVAGLVAAEAPDAIVHTAYLQRGDAARAVNVDGAAHVAAAARAAGARLVHVSSDAIFSGAGDRPLREDDPADPVTPYGATKAAAEPAVLAAHPGAVLVRTSLIYGGPGIAPSPHEEVALAAAAGEQDVAFFTDEIRSPIQVGDLAAALVELAASAVPAGPLHVGGADAVSRLDFAQLIVAARGGARHTVALAGRLAPPDRPRCCPLDSTRAQALLAVRLRGVHEVLGSP